MTQTIIGVFNSFDRANAAMATLASQGLAGREHMHVSANEGVTGYEAGTTESGAVVSPAYREDAAGEGHHKGVIGTIEHFFSHLFGNDDRPAEAEHYQEAVRRGSALLAVDVDNEAQIETVESVLERAGAVDIDARVAHWQADGYTGYDGEAAPFTAEAAAHERETFPVVEEELAVGKREVETGRLRVVSRPIEQNVSESVSLHEEHAEIERRAVNREATAADLTARSVEIRETDELPVVAKTARVVEEVVVGKQGSNRVETVNETLRGNAVEIEESANLREGSVLPADAVLTKNDPKAPKI